MWSIAWISLERRVSLSVYFGRSRRLKQVWETGRYSSPPPVDWMTSIRLFIPRIGMRSLPVKNTAKKKTIEPTTFYQNNNMEYQVIKTITTAKLYSNICSNGNVTSTGSLSPEFVEA